MIRIIPRLDVKGSNLIKGVHLEGLRVLGRVEDFAKRYNGEGADAIFYVDSVASLYGRTFNADVINAVAKQLLIPLTVEGGIRTINDVCAVLRCGADKVALNTSVVQNPNLIKEISGEFGTQCVVLSIVARSLGFGRYECMTHNGREPTGLDVFEWARREVDLGAGEVLITSVDQEGTGRGYDLELVSKLADMVGVSVVASGGAGNKEHVAKVIMEGKANAACVASMFHYACSDKKWGLVQTTNVLDLKLYLVKQGLNCRMALE